MGSSNTKESRPEYPGATHHGSTSTAHDASSSPRTESSDRRNRHSRFGRAELGLLGLSAAGSSSTTREDAPYERKETRQEREARRLERERVAREKERERSMREENVDGGYLVTLGTYTGPEDFNKQIVRQLQIERRIAPFWRGLNDKDDSWTEYQLVCAGRGLPIPAADKQPPEEFIPRPKSPQSPNTSSPNLANLTVPLGPRTMSTGSDRSASTANASPALGSPASPNPQRPSSPFRPRAKALAAALSMGSRNNSSSDMTPRELNLPQDPFVNGQPIEVFLYKGAIECPICFLYYPPYLNRTRCCHQPICSECFVQIKRADPHFPEHHGDDASAQPNPDEQPPEMLISEPAHCPYCQQNEFGVTYDPPPFRRGLAYATPPLSSQHTAMSSQSSLVSTMSPTPASAGAAPARRGRAQSLSANAPNVVTTDRIRPDWSTKLAAQRAHQARRAAAATALHTAAFLIGDESNRSRGFPFARPGRFSRRNTGQDGASDSNAGANSTGALDGESRAGLGPTGGLSNRVMGRRSRMEELEEMMFVEAIRLSLAAEEERKRKEEKAVRKEAKKKEKEERKAARKAEKQGSFYGGSSSASGSSLSLGLGRRRGNSGASNLRMEASLQNAQAAHSTSSLCRVPETPPSASTDTGTTSTAAATSDKGKGVDRSPTEADTGEGIGPSATTGGSSSLPIPIMSRVPSHLRQISNASSISSSLGDSAAGSSLNQDHHHHLDADSPQTSATSPGQRSGDGADHDSSEPMYNFRSLAEIVGVDIESGETTGSRRSTEGKADAHRKPEVEHMEDTGDAITQASVATLKPPPTIPEGVVPEEQGAASGDRDGEVTDVRPGSNVTTPEVTITTDTPGSVEGDVNKRELSSDRAVEQTPATTNEQA
ncbi:hypothetical protein SODALDRAFT_336441 [Sodiomyces alkalinus F11]|uniref:Uncharacterized protein n=1 Tax=Sodiomyces alkalinus (strain CBS 110278 / VKM F-3762 / F11) TaxID=1314773 RepID=A0A3N2Q7W5_SODAK|nr:hypothetical protein SODALDRAFT_336441 [Sodiomyces alkalinus F11]ROT42864.1 hypothetical protein SODALDRAFT_336441 [Sodiomyces alkalinus F11]